MMSSSNQKLIPLFIFFSICSFKSSLSTANNPIFCLETEKQSLLSFKQSLEDPTNLLASWDDEVNCCRWKGVVCNHSTGGVDGLRVEGLKGKINPSLLKFHHLKYLDLSKNNFSGETIPSFMGSLANLQYLNLSGSNFHGKIPHSLGNLSNLHTLDLGDGLFLYVDSLEWISRLSQLEYLNMNDVRLYRAHNWAHVINSLPSLLELHFHFCDLDFMALPNDVNSSSLKHLDLSNNLPYLSTNALSRWIFQLTNLVYLDLSWNKFDALIPSSSNATKLKYVDLSWNSFNSTIPEWLYLCQDLEYIDLSSNMLSGAISNSIENLTSLYTLIAYSNQLSGKIPKGIAKYLCKMQRLDLSNNIFQGEISESFGNMSDCFLGGLQTLSLDRNRLSGNLTNQFGDFRNLRYLDLRINSLSGVIPSTIGKLFSLEELWLNGNKLVGTLPQSLGQLFNLRILCIADNMLEGVVTEAHFANLTKLLGLFASGNHLTLHVSPHWNPLFRLSSLMLGSWNLGSGSQVPSWIETQENILGLDLSNTGISGNVPAWAWKIEVLTLSHNNLHGNIPYIPGLKDRSQYIYLDSNQFNGSLPRIGNTLAHLDLSNNSFSEGLSGFLCDTTHDAYELEVLHLGRNRLSGEVPDCLMKWPSLRYLNLGYNNLSGSIPNSVGNLARLWSLNLPCNRLSGEIPFSMHNFTELVKLDLGSNFLGGGIPTWLGRGLAFLILRSNNLSGDISSELCRLNSLQILDLSDNKISGIIPRCFNNLTAMATKRSLDRGKYSRYAFWEFVESASVTTRGSELQYGTTLSLVTNIDLSRNNLFGNIPKELTSLVELRSLNLSQNHLTGPIPENIGDMKQLEFLDFSHNSLSGHIPNNVTSLYFLTYLNLSYNKLTGEIPKSTQVGGMDASSFIGNNLCGPPLTSNCSHDRDRRKEEGDEEEGESKIEWLYVVTSLGYAVGLSAVCSALLLKRSWREAYFVLLERIWNNMYVYVCIKWNKISG